MENQVHWENNLDEGYTCKVIKKAPTYGELFLESLETGKSEFISLVPIQRKISILRGLTKNDH